MTDPECCSTEPARGVFLARVVANQMICREHYRLTLGLSAFPAAKPGQFVHIRCTEPNDLGWTGGAFIRRPFSIGGLRRTSEQVEIDVLHRAIGIGTKYLARLRPGDAVNLLGPLGQPFRMPVWDRTSASSVEPHLAGPGHQREDRLEAGPTQDAGPTPDRPIALLVGGGIGLPPLIWLAEALQGAGVPAIAFCGSRTADLLPLTLEPGGLAAPASRRCSTGETPVPQEPVAQELKPTLFCREFSQMGVPGMVATDDGSLGVRGLIPEVLATWLDRNPAVARSAAVYTCGPDRMMRAVAAVCRQRDLPCQVCLERMMACGMGTCQSCVVRIRDEAASEGWRYRLCCTDGPVFDARDVLWG